MKGETPREALMRLRRRGRPDALYWLQLTQAVDGNWLVKFGYGEVGRPMNQAMKTPQPVPYAVAATIYRIYFDEKTGRGYEVVTDLGSLAGRVPTPNDWAAEPDRRPFKRALVTVAKQIDVDPLTKNNSGSKVNADGERRSSVTPRKLRF